MIALVRRAWCALVKGSTINGDGRRRNGGLVNGGVSGRRTSLVMGAGAAALLAACATPGPGTLRTPVAKLPPATITRGDVARVVSSDLAAGGPAGGLAPAVVCADDVPAQVGSVDRCTATDLAARTRRPITAQVTALTPQLAVVLTVGAPITPTFDP